MSLFPIIATIPQGGICLQGNKCAYKPRPEGGSPLIDLSRAEEEEKTQGVQAPREGMARGHLEHPNPNISLLVAGSLMDGAG